MELQSTTTMANSNLIDQAYAYSEKYMSQYDGSHDFEHILRVLGLAQKIAKASNVDYEIVTLAALLHDVGDKKYLQPGQDAFCIVQNLLTDFGADEVVSKKVQTIVTNVSYSSEIKNPEKVLEVIQGFPELAVVQDADRLDAIGAVGIGRTFTFGGAKRAEGGMNGTLEHFTDKLEKLEGMMKTEMGRKMARERTERLQVFRTWWAEELADAGR